MRAIYIDAYGPANEVIRLDENAPKPSPAAGEVLIRVHACSVNPVDCAMREGYGREIFGSLGSGIPPFIPGRDMAGTIEEIGEGVDSFKLGEAVFALTNGRTCAEFATAKATLTIPKPDNVSFVEAASIPFIALSAWEAIVTLCKLTPDTTAGQKVLIPRGSGGVGSFAIQLVKAWGGYVVSTCSARNMDMVRALGADDVIDYQSGNVEDVLSEFDVVIDTLGHDAEVPLLSVLKQNGGARYAGLISPKMRLTDEHGIKEGLQRYETILAERKAAQAKLGRAFNWSFMTPDGDALRAIGALMAEGKIRAVIDRKYPMEQLAAAHDYIQSKRARGKVMIRIRED